MESKWYADKDINYFFLKKISILSHDRSFLVTKTGENIHSNEQKNLNT